MSLYALNEYYYHNTGDGCGESGNEDGDGDDCGWVSYRKTGFGVCGYTNGDGEEVEIDLEFE
jgi:hypothetical protein